MVRRGQRRAALRDLRGPSRAVEQRAGTAGAVALTTARDRRGSRPQGRPAFVRPVRIGAVFGAPGSSAPPCCIAVHGTKIRVLEPFTGEIAAEHVLVAPGESSIAPDAHYGSSRPDKPRRAPRPRTDGEKQFLALGETASPRSWPALPGPGLRTCPGRSARSSPCRPPTAQPPSSRRWNGRRSSGGGGPVTCARSWPRPAPRPRPPHRRAGARADPAGPCRSGH